MLVQLHIQNYALIKDSLFKPNQGLNTLTGETGAGKSILLGALGLITGKRADTSVLFDKDSKCIVEATFNIANYSLETLFDNLELDYEPETIIRREITPAGKSRAFVNDTPITLDNLKQIGVHLIDIHSQHETVKLNTQGYQTNILDLLSDSKPSLNKYTKQYKKVIKLKTELSETISNSEKQKSELDYNLFLLNELQSVPLAEIDIEKLESEVKTIENFAEIKTLLSGIYNNIEEGEYSLNLLLGESTALSKDLSKLSPEYTSIDDRLQNLYIELQDLAKEVANANDNLSLDDESAESKIMSFNKVQSLLKKHFVTSTPELVNIQDDLIEKTEKASSLDEYISDLKSKLESEEATLIDLGNNLHKKRSSKCKSIGSAISNMCAELGMPDASFQIAFEQLDSPSPLGLFKIKFLFSANKGVKPEEISKVASGGEFSRLMFSLKNLLAEKVSLPTIIFDEIDTGISGEIALKMGKIMEDISDKHQLICITHLPQIASKGSNHFYVYKNNKGTQTISMIKQLDSEERILKIAEMIEGENPGESAIKSAKALLN